MYAKVLIEYNSKSVDKTFTYVIPKSITNLSIGMKVIVPFGTRYINGFVLEIVDTYEENYDLKEIIRVEDEFLKLNDELLNIGKHLKDITLCSQIAAYQTMLPSSLKVKDRKQNYNKYVSYIELVCEYDAEKYIEENQRSKKQIAILEELLIKKRIPKKDLASGALNILLERKIVKEVKEQVYRLKTQNIAEVQPQLTSDQKKAINTVELDKENTYLLHGVTGSGKTEVYMSLIDKVLSTGKTAILLVPEITLTTQIVSRFYKRFGNIVAIFHSALSEGEKYDEYLKILRGEVDIVIGARSAIFAPLNNLGIIIIDEEHSDNYKQDNTPRYHALDIAKYRSHYHNIPLVLGSATPSLETMARASKGVYKLIEMPHRIGKAILPTSTIVDMTKEIKKGHYIFSELLINKIQERLANQEQIILLLNRRGFSTFVTCHNCGFTHKCPHCDITLTYHKTSNNLRCHYCGFTIFKNDVCPECHEKSLNFLGLGTEKLELEVKKLFPTAKVVRMDTDTTQNKGAHQKIIDDFANHNYDILLGTQMISKGLDFPLVTLVGVINADASLNIPDFRSSEKTYSLLSQVSGRAGRSDLAGEVIIQTQNPDNYTLQCVCSNSYIEHYQKEMTIRKMLSYPPYYYLVSIKVASKDYKIASTEITKVKNYLAQKLSDNSIILGPTTAANFRINNIYRFQIIIKYKKDDNLMPTLKELDELFVLNKNANIEIDINPSHL